MSKSRDGQRTDHLERNLAVRSVQEGASGAAELPFCSVIIPTHSRPALLRQCLEALAKSEYPHDRFEVIVVDDGSRPAVNGMAEAFAGRMVVRVLRQERTGPAGARNAGVALARGELLAFTDDDCRPEPGWLGVLSEYLRSHPNQLVGGQTLNGLPVNAYSTASQQILDAVYEHANRNWADAGFLASNNLALCARAFAEIQGFDSRFQTSEDRDLCDRWRAAGWTMAYLHDARIRHFHDLHLTSFLRQHFHYGQGAFMVYRVHTRRKAERFNHPASFYRRFLFSPFTRQPTARAFVSFALIVVSQAASAAGFFWAWTRGDRNLGRPTSDGGGVDTVAQTPTP